MPKYGESLSKISLRELLNEQELEDIKKYSQFKLGEEKGFKYEKEELILKFVRLVIDRFTSMKENTLTKCFKWVKIMLQENVEIKMDISIFKNLEKMKKAKPNLKIKSLLNKEEERYKLTRKTLQKYSAITDKTKDEKK